MRTIVLTALAASAFVLTGCTSGLLRGPSDVTFSNFEAAPRYSARHYNWCATVRPAYRRSDNSYGIGRHKRYRCVSPYITDPA